MHVSWKKGLRVGASNSRTPLTGRAATLRRGARRAGRAETHQRVTRRKTKIRGIAGGARQEVRAHPVSFVSTLFEIDSI